MLSLSALLAHLYFDNGKPKQHKNNLTCLPLTCSQLACKAFNRLVRLPGVDVSKCDDRKMDGISILETAKRGLNLCVHNYLPLPYPTQEMPPPESTKMHRTRKSKHDDKQIQKKREDHI